VHVHAITAAAAAAAIALASIRFSGSTTSTAHIFFGRSINEQFEISGRRFSTHEFHFQPFHFLGTSQGLVSASVVSLTCTAVQVAAGWLQAYLLAGLCEATDGVGGGRQAGHKPIVPFLC
jgi:hypothetical protein